MSTRHDQSSIESFHLRDFYIFAVAVLLFGFFGSLKLIFGTFSIFKVLKDYDNHQKFSEYYNKKQDLRESILYHVSWAKSRGDFKEANEMMMELKAVDMEIDEIEATYGPLYFGTKKS